jgi:hypothetical protein
VVRPLLCLRERQRRGYWHPTAAKCRWSSILQAAPCADPPGWRIELLIRTVYTADAVDGSEHSEGGGYRIALTLNRKEVLVAADSAQGPPSQDVGIG